ncbi:MAG: hypothetical protein GF400_04910 [Candidatus Eisenbacteria bacterium]|nr:hypothetical protein [Candidatus Eisenbacteria bacterium]
MRYPARVFAIAVLVAVSCAVVSGCAGSRGGGDIPDDPVLIRKELVEIERQIQNTEEILKGSKAQLQMDETQELREEIRSLEMDLIHLESQQRALEERLEELKAEGKS